MKRNITLKVTPEQRRRVGLNAAMCGRSISNYVSKLIDDFDISFFVLEAGDMPDICSTMQLSICYSLVGEMKINQLSEKYKTHTAHIVRAVIVKGLEIYDSRLTSAAWANRSSVKKRVSLTLTKDMIGLIDDFAEVSSLSKSVALLRLLGEAPRSGGDLLDSVSKYIGVCADMLHNISISDPDGELVSALNRMRVKMLAIVPDSELRLSTRLTNSAIVRAVLRAYHLEV